MRKPPKAARLSSGIPLRYFEGSRPCAKGEKVAVVDSTMVQPVLAGGAPPSLALLGLGGLILVGGAILILTHKKKKGTSGP